MITLDYINRGLKENQLCIYASVNAADKPHLSTISSKIINYEENLNKGNLWIVNLKPFYDSALICDLAPFVKLKKQIQQELEYTNNKSVIIVADCADNLFQNQYFDQSELVESWWHRVHREWTRFDNNIQRYHRITIVCPHLDLLLHKHPFNQHKHKILDNHSAAIDITGHTIVALSTSLMHREEPPLQPAKPSSSQIESQTHILVAEPDPDLRFVYSMWLHSRGFKNILVTESGRRCLEEFLRIKNINQRSNVIVILDSHLRDISFVELAKQITNRRPDQIIIFTTTLPSDIINSICINNKESSKILLKPFRLSKLLPFIYNTM